MNEVALDRLLTVDEVAERLRRSTSAVQWMIHKGTGPKFAKIGGRRMARQSDVEAYIAAAFEDEKASA